VFLIGDANIDYRNYLQTDMKNIVPVHLSETYPFGLTGDDGWYACVDGDDVLPDMMIGRAPAGKVESVFALVDKIISHENEPVTVSTKNLFISDNDERSFQLLNDAMSTIPPPEYAIQRVYLNEYSDWDAATNDVIAGIREGRLVTNYVGHGSARQWAGEPVFENADVLRLENGHPLTFVLSMNCLSGYFSHPSKYCLAEAFVSAENRGAIAIYAPSGGAYVWQLQLLDHGLFSLMFKRFLNPVGAIVTYAEISAFAEGLNDDGLEMFNLFGDPASRLHYIGKPGDFDGNGIVELKDALVILRILAKASGTSTVIDVEAGIGEKPGIRDVLYILQSAK
jgi:hypothetical protein